MGRAKRVLIAEVSVRMHALVSVGYGMRHPNGRALRRRRAMLQRRARRPGDGRGLRWELPIQVSDVFVTTFHRPLADLGAFLGAKLGRTARWMVTAAPPCRATTALAVSRLNVRMWTRKGPLLGMADPRSCFSRGLCVRVHSSRRLLQIMWHRPAVV